MACQVKYPDDHARCQGSPGDVMELLPTNSALIVEAKLKPADIAYIRNDLPAAIKLDAFDYSVYGVARRTGQLHQPSMPQRKDPGWRNVHYRVQIRINEDALARRNREHLGKPVEIQPGMTANNTIEIRTGSQTVLAYLTKPVTKTFSESFGER